MINTSRIALDKLMLSVADSIEEQSILLDAGAGDCAYMEFFKSKNIVYESADNCLGNHDYSKITYTCNLDKIPTEDNRFDTIICIQVLEHTNNPQQVLDELYRVLKPNGQIFLTAPFIYEEHDIPFDFYRYTQYGLRHLFEKSSFKVQRIEHLEGFYGTIAYHLDYFSKHLSRLPKNYIKGFRGIFSYFIVLIGRYLFTFFAYIFSKLELRIKYTKSGNSKNYLIVATKNA